MTMIEFAPAIDPEPITVHQTTHVAYERNTTRHVVVGLLVHPFAPVESAVDVLLRSVERQARLAGCGRVHLAVTQ